jgi:hypothetical protein
MTNKQRILQMVERWDDDISFDRALYHLHVMKEVMASIKEVDEGGELIEHDDFFDELERLCDEEENQAQLVAKGEKKPNRDPKTHSSRRLPKNGEIVRSSPKKVRTPTS